MMSALQIGDACRTQQRHPKSLDRHTLEDGWKTLGAVTSEMTWISITIINQFGSAYFRANSRPFGHRRPASSDPAPPRARKQQFVFVFRTQRTRYYLDARIGSPRC